jgi:hypothetical protein
MTKDRDTVATPTGCQFRFSISVGRCKTAETMRWDPPQEIALDNTQTAPDGNPFHESPVKAGE